MPLFPKEDIPEQITNRKWHYVTDYWIRRIPNITDAGIRPGDKLADVLDAQNLINRDFARHEEEISVVRPIIFHESLYLQHRALNVMIASEECIKAGKLTWAISSAYQSSFFSVKSILCLLGVGITETQGKTYLLDIWPNASHISDQGRKVNWEPVVFFYRIGTLDHRDIWTLFKRLIAITKFEGEIIPSNYLAVIRKTKPKEFAKHRNDIHYRDKWLFDDLHIGEDYSQHDFGKLTFDGKFTENKYGTFDMACLLSSFYMALLLSLQEKSNLVKSYLEAEMNLYKNKLMSSELFFMSENDLATKILNKIAV